MNARVVRSPGWIPATTAGRLGIVAVVVALLGAGGYAAGTAVSPASPPPAPVIIGPPAPVMVGPPVAGHGGHP